MKIYFRLLSYCRPIGKRVLPYSIFTLFTIIFGLLNLTLIIPLLDVLFGTTESEDISAMLVKPDFNLSLDYIKNIFQYYFAITIKEYGRYAALQMVCLVIVISVLLTNIFRYLSSVELELLKVQTIRNIRNAAFSKIIKMQLSYFSNERKGDIMARVTSDVNEIEGSISNSLSVVFKEPITLVTYFIVLLAMSFKLTMFTLLIIPISGIIISFFTKKLRKASTESFVSFGRLIGIIDETLSSMRVVKAFNGEAFTYDKYRKENDLYTNLLRSINLKKELASPFSEFSGILVVSFILLYGGSLVLSNQSELSASEFVVYIGIFSQVLRPAKAISNSFTGLQRGIAAGERVLQLIDLPILVTEKPNPIKIPAFKDAIEFKNVTFSYHEKAVLKNINFKIKAGKMIALVGPSGGGKTTISDLVPRFYDPQEGQILIDGVDLKDAELYSLRSLMGVVTQESILFNDTIYNNIAFGKPDASQEEIEKAARIANAHEFIIKTEHGYQTYIGDRGVKLSGGQKQRLSIARAVLKNPPILILDEATSALDTESEKLVQEALDNLMKNRTSLVIAHRLSTIQNADEIYVLKDGEIIESGAHEELLQKESGLYKKLQMMQSI